MVDHLSADLPADLPADLTVDPAVDPALEALLCFDLYAAHRAVTAAYRPVLEDLGLTYPQYLVMVLLWRHGTLSIKEVGARLHLDHATLTPLLRRLEAAGMVERERDAADRRSVILRPTAEGAALAPVVDDVQCRIGEAMGIDQATADELSGLLRRLAGNLRGSGSDRPASRG